MIGQLPPIPGFPPAIPGHPQWVLQVRYAPAGRTLDSAITEKRRHRARFLAMTSEDPPKIDVRTNLADFDGELHDIRGRGELADVYDQLSYAAAQTLARALKAVNCHGINQAVRRRSKKP